MNSINLGKHNGFDMSIHYEYEELITEDLQQEDIDAYNRGEFSCVWIEARACRCGVQLGHDYLGQCFIKNEENIKQTVNENDMIQNAINDAKEVLKRLIESENK